MAFAWSRRAFVSAVALATRAAAADRTPTLPSEVRRLRDPATEFELTRLTDPRVANATLPRPPLRIISSKHNYLLYCSDRGESPQAYRLDLKTGESRQWTEAAALDRHAVCILPDEKSLLYIDGNQLTALASKPKVIYTAEAGWAFAPGLSVSDDGVSAALVEQRSGRFRLRIVGVKTGAANSLVEASEPVRFARFRPKQNSVVYNLGGVLTLVNLDGRNSKRLAIADGAAGEALWSADGRALHYLMTPREPGRSIQMREYFPDTNEDKLIGSTTQFVTFARNADSSVFAGMSGSKASPYVLLLLRAAHRELTLAEHRTSSTGNATISFSPNSQRLFFTSDREGKSAIYGMMLERFVEKTDLSAEALIHADSATV